MTKYLIAFAAGTATAALVGPKVKPLLSEQFGGKGRGPYITGAAFGGVGAIGSLAVLAALR